MSTTAGQVPSTATPQPKKRPDARPMRLVFGAGAMAALSVMSVGLVRLPVADSSTTEIITKPGPAVAGPDIRVNQVIREVHLKPGQTAPRGATVNTPTAPAPHVLVTHAAPPAAAQPQRRVIVVTRTRQSGHP
jgi:hypothetical protein